MTVGYINCIIFCAVTQNICTKTLKNLWPVCTTFDSYKVCCTWIVILKYDQNYLFITHYTDWL